MLSLPKSDDPIISQYLDGISYRRIHSNIRSPDRIEHVAIVGIHFEILEIVDDFCSAVLKLDDVVQHHKYDFTVAHFLIWKTRRAANLSIVTYT